MFFDINIKDRNFRRLDPTLMTTMIGYEDRQVNIRALIHARGFILYLRVYGVYGTN